MHPIIEQHREAVEAACQKYGATRLEVFGSAARDDFDEQRSDLDFIVEFQRPGPMHAAAQYFGFLHALEDMFERKVDLVEPAGMTNPYFIKSVNESRKFVYGA